MFFFCCSFRRRRSSFVRPQFFASFSTFFSLSRRCRRFCRNLCSCFSRSAITNAKINEIRRRFFSLAAYFSCSVQILFRVEHFFVCAAHVVDGIFCSHEMNVRTAHIAQDEKIAVESCNEIATRIRFNCTERDWAQTSRIDWWICWQQRDSNSSSNMPFDVTFGCNVLIRRYLPLVSIERYSIRLLPNCASRFHRCRWLWR